MEKGVDRSRKRADVLYVWKQKDVVGKLPAGITQTGCAERDRWATRDCNNWETHDIHITFTSHPLNQPFASHPSLCLSPSI